MKNYYNLPKYVQWSIAIVFFIIGGLFFGWFVNLEFYWVVLFLPFFAPIFNFAFTPFFRLIGYFKYLNPLILSTVQSDKRYDLHNAMTFDYLVHFKWEDRGAKVQTTILGHFIKALLTIVERIENGELSPDVKIEGNSYFFNERTAEKLGFKVSKTSFFWVINSVMQFVELSYLYSFSQGKLAIPKFWKVRKATTTGRELVEKKEYLEKMSALLLKEWNL